jgi:hypothetical protein
MALLAFFVFGWLTTAADLASLEAPFDSEPTDSRDLPPSRLDPTPSALVRTSTDQEWSDYEEEEQQRRLMFFVATVLTMMILAMASLYVYCQKRIEAEQNTEYTRPIIADDVYEFTHLDGQ